jgi:hypothetical protein
VPYFEDLSVAHNNLRLGRAMVNVGWLDEHHPFPTGPTDQQLVDDLAYLATAPRNVTRGVHTCGFCGKRPIHWPHPSRAETFLLGHGEVHVQFDAWGHYAAPTLIAHYVADHHYRPPGGFASAVKTEASRRRGTREWLTSIGVDERMAGQRIVVWERLARAAGYTRWYVVTNLSDMDELAAELRAGSIVWFNVGGRYTFGPLDESVHAQLMAVAARDGAAVVADGPVNGIEWRAADIAGDDDFTNFAADHPPGSLVFYGPYPGPDAMEDAVSAQVPDADGVVRPQPH